MDVNDQRARGTSSRASVKAIENVMRANIARTFQRDSTMKALFIRLIH